MTSGQPWRIKERVPSKSKSTWLICGRGAKEELKSTLPLNAGVDAGRGCISDACKLIKWATDYSFCRLKASKGAEEKLKMCPGGTSENSPAFQRWDLRPEIIGVPKGRLKTPGISMVPSGINHPGTWISRPRTIIPRNEPALHQPRATPPLPPH